MGDKCIHCGQPYIRVKPNQRFCPGGKCRAAFHNAEKGFMLSPRLRDKIMELAAAHEVSGNEMLIRMVDKLLNPDGKPVSDSEAMGTDQVTL